MPDVNSSRAKFVPFLVNGKDSTAESNPRITPMHTRDDLRHRDGNLDSNAAGGSLVDRLHAVNRSNCGRHTMFSLVCQVRGSY
jgi:hypothetical protein